MRHSVFHSTFMYQAAERGEFAPPPQAGHLRAFALAVIAHLLLLGALTWGVNWKRQSENLAVEAELWSALPQEAAPKAVQPPPPAPTPAPPRPEVKKPEPPVVRDADIAIEREKKRLEKEKAEREKEEDKREQAKKAADDKKRQLEVAKAKEAERVADTKRQEAERQKNIERALGQAGATGAPAATGNAQQSSGPSPGYAGRIRARIKPNIVFTEDMAGNPTAEVEVRVAPDGTIVGRRLTKSSGVKTWDEAVLKAIDKTEVLPRDADGRVPPAMAITFRPKD